MTLLQASHEVPVAATYDIGFIDHIREGVVRTFYEGLDKTLTYTPGGIILAQPRISTVLSSPQFINEEMVTFIYSANCEELPVPPEYRLIGGPADGSIVRTHGQREWLVPVIRPRPFTTGAERVRMQAAEYERQGDTAAYFFRRVSER